LTFFAAGRVMTGLLVLLMQASLVLWPAAYSMARQLNESSAIDRILSELAAAYQLPADGVHHPPRKRFRTAEGAGAAPGRAFGASGGRRLRPAA
jgi:hypothetical protein